MLKKYELNNNQNEIDVMAEAILTEPICYLPKNEVARRNAILSKSTNYSHEEYVDYLSDNGDFQYDEYGVRRLVVLKKKKAHKEGIPHREIHVSLLDKNGEAILMQQRVASKDLYPNAWDISVGGHVAAYEDPKIAVLRELEEELGIKVNYVDLQKLCEKPIKEKLVKGKVNNIAFVDTFIIYKNIDLDQIYYQEDEVQTAKWCTKDQFLEIVNNGNAIPHQEEYKALTRVLKRK